MFPVDSVMLRTNLNQQQYGYAQNIVHNNNNASTNNNSSNNTSNNNAFNNGNFGTPNFYNSNANNSMSLASNSGAENSATINNNSYLNLRGNNNSNNAVFAKQQLQQQPQPQPPQQQQQQYYHQPQPQPQPQPQQQPPPQQQVIYGYPTQGYQYNLPPQQQQQQQTAISVINQGAPTNAVNNNNIRYGSFPNAGVGSNQGNYSAFAASNNNNLNSNVNVVGGGGTNARGYGNPNMSNNSNNNNNNNNSGGNRGGGPQQRPPHHAGYSHHHYSSNPVPTHQVHNNIYFNQLHHTTSNNAVAEKTPTLSIINPRTRATLHIKLNRIYNTMADMRPQLPAARRGDDEDSADEQTQQQRRKNATPLLICLEFLSPHGCPHGSGCDKVHIAGLDYAWEVITPALQTTEGAAADAADGAKDAPAYVAEEHLGERYAPGFLFKCYDSNKVRYFKIPSANVLVSKGSEAFIQMYNEHGDNFKRKFTLAPVCETVCNKHKEAIFGTTDPKRGADEAAEAWEAKVKQYTAACAAELKEELLAAHAKHQRAAAAEGEGEGEGEDGHNDAEEEEGLELYSIFPISTAAPAPPPQEDEAASSRKVKKSGASSKHVFEVCSSTHVNDEAQMASVPRLPADMVVRCYNKNSCEVFNDYPGSLVLMTEGAKVYKKAHEALGNQLPVKKRMQHCAHFRANDMCRLGASCRFLHVLMTARELEERQAARQRRAQQAEQEEGAEDDQQE